MSLDSRTRALWKKLLSKDSEGISVYELQHALDMVWKWLDERPHRVVPPSHTYRAFVDRLVRERRAVRLTELLFRTDNRYSEEKSTFKPRRTK